MVDAVRRATRDKKAATSLKVVEAWNIIIGIVDTYIIAYDLHTFSQLNQIPETKGTTHRRRMSNLSPWPFPTGTTVYSINERASVLCVGQKHKMKVFSFLGGLSGFSLRRELAFNETPRVLFPVGGGGGCLIVGFKKHYEALDAHSYASTRLLEFEREHKLVCVEVGGAGPIYPCEGGLSVQPHMSRPSSSSHYPLLSVRPQPHLCARSQLSSSPLGLRVLWWMSSGQVRPVWWCDMD